MFALANQLRAKDDGRGITGVVSHLIALKKWRERSEKIKGEFSDKAKGGTSGGSVFFRDVQHSGMTSKLYMTVPASVKPEDLMDILETEWKLPVPTIILQIISSPSTANKMSNHSQLANLQNGIIKAASKTEMWIVTNGVNAGMAKAVGSAVNSEVQRRRAQTCPRHLKQSSLGLPHLTLIGIVPTSLLRYPESFLEKTSVVRVTSVGNIPSENKYELNAYHSHFLIVKDSTTEVLPSHKLMLALASFLKDPPTVPADEEKELDEEVDKKTSLKHARPPMVALLVGGGYTSARAVKDHLRNQVPVVVLKGSGGAADILAFAYQEIKEQPRGSWDPEYMETFILPELSKMIAMFFKKYREDGVGRSNFREDIIECISMSHPDENQVLLTFLDIDSQNCDLTNLNENLLRGLAKGEKRETSGLSWQRYLKKDLYLTLDWNCPHIARSEVLTGDFIKSEIDAKVFENALLRLNHEAFIDLFLDKGFEVRLFLTNKRLMLLFEESKDVEFFQSVCLEGALGYTGKQKRRGFLVRDLNWLVYQMTNIKNMIQLRDDLYDAKEVSVEPKVARSEERNARNALVVWAVLMNRDKLAKVLWKHSDYPIQLALVISMMYSKLLSYVKEKHENKQIGDLSTEFANMAVGILDMSFQASSCRAFDVLSQEVPEFNWKTVVEIAATARNRKFIAHACCQKWLTSLFYGEIRIRELKYGLFKVPSIIKIFLSAIFIFPAYIWIVFKTPEKASVANALGWKAGVKDVDDGNVEIFAEEGNLDEVKPRNKNNQFPLYSPAVCPKDTHLDLVPLFETEDHKASPGNFRTRAREAIVKAARYLEAWHYIPILWKAPVTKFWMHQIFYILYLTLFSVATLWQSCGHFTLDAVVWVWTLLLLVENCFIIRMRQMGHGLLKLQWSILESILMAGYLVVFFIARILPSPQFTWDGVWVNREFLLSAYQGRIVTCLGLLYFYYRFVWIYFPISPTLGRLLFRIQHMVTRDFLQFLRLTMLFIVSSGIVIHSAIFPDFPMSVELIRRVFHRSWFSLFTMFITDLEGDKACAGNITKPTDGVCRLSSYESHMCPVTGAWPYLLNIQFMIILKLILLTLLYALFSDTAAKLASDADAIWRFQRYHLVQNFVARPSVPAPLNCISIPIGIVHNLVKLLTGRFTFRKSPMARHVKSINNMPATIHTYDKGIVCMYSHPPAYNEANQSWVLYQKFHGELDNLDDAEVSADSLYWQSLARQYSEDHERSGNDLPAQQMKKFDDMTVMLGAQNFAMQAINARISELELTMTASWLTLENIVRSVSDEQEEALNLGNKHHHSRISCYPETPIKRFPVADKYVPWEVLFTVYDPVEYNKPAGQFGPNVVPYVDEDRLTTDDGAIPWNTVSEDGVDRSSWISTRDGLPVTIVTDTSGAPLNPMGRTGLRGRGGLARWGPNHCCILVITRYSGTDNFTGSVDTSNAGQEKNLFVLTVTPPDGGLVTLPMGYAKGPRNAYSSVRNVFLPEDPGTWTVEDMCMYFQTFSETVDYDFASVVSDSPVTKVNLQKTRLHTGYLDDGRNTDNAWVEAEVWHLHYQGNKYYPVADQGVLKWSKWSKDLMNSMVANHSNFVKAIVGKTAPLRKF